MPRFSVLLPARNAERYVCHAVDSVLEQTCAADAEVIVVDDASTDGTVAVLAGYGERLVLLDGGGRGTAAARNQALAHSTGEIVVLLDHDDELHPAFLERVGEVFDLREDVGLVSADAWCFDERRGRLLARTYLQLWPLPRRLDLLHLVRANFVPPRAAIRRNGLVALGGFDEQLPGVDDYDVFLRLLATGHSLVILEEPLAYYRIRPGSLGSDRLAMAALAERALAKARRSGWLDAEADREALIRIGAWRERAHLARAERALGARTWSEAAGHFAEAWRASPLRWRPVRIGYFALAGLLRRRRWHAEPQKEGRPAPAMRVLANSAKRPSPALLEAFRALRRAVGTHAPPRRRLPSSTVAR